MKKILILLCVIICTFPLISCGSPDLKINKEYESVSPKVSSAIDIRGLYHKSPNNNSVIKTAYRAKELADEFIKTVDIGEYNSVYVDYDIENELWVVIYSYEFPDVVQLDTGTVVKINDLTGELISANSTTSDGCYIVYK